MKTILIVDDEQEIRDMLKKRLEQNGYLTLTASGGNEAVTLSSDSKPDLILLDIAMPVMDGYETCEQLKKNKETRGIPVLFLTAKDLDPKGMQQRLEELGAWGYLPKPSTFSQLLEKIKEAIG